MKTYKVWTCCGAYLGGVRAVTDEQAIYFAKKKYPKEAKYMNLHLFNDELGYTWNLDGEKGPAIHHNPLVAQWDGAVAHWHDAFMTAIRNNILVKVTPCGADETWVNIVLTDPDSKAVTYPICEFVIRGYDERIDMLKKIIKTLTRE